jgi:antitoxin component YwqK of YwqJK toxin-antitoxin module
MRTKSILFIFIFSFFSVLAFSQGEPPKGFSGEWVTKYKSGKVSFKGKYVAGKPEGKCFYYFENGQIRFEGSYLNGLKDGLWIAYFDNGQIRFKAKYVKGDQSEDRVYY